MPDDERLVSVVREWVEKAENDLQNTAHTLELGERCPTDTVRALLPPSARPRRSR